MINVELLGEALDYLDKSAEGGLNAEALTEMGVTQEVFDVIMARYVVAQKRNINQGKSPVARLASAFIVGMSAGILVGRLEADTAFRTLNRQENNDG